jgi:hypothetical protein
MEGHRLRIGAALGGLGLLLSLASASPLWAAAKVTAVAGKAEIYDAVQKQWKPAKVGEEIPVGGGLRADSGSRATISSAGGGVTVQVTQKGRIAYGGTSGDQGVETYRMEQGAGWYKVRKGTKLDVQTPVLVASVRGTEFGVAVEEDGTSSVAVTGGSVDVTDATGKTQSLGAGMSTTVSAAEMDQALSPPTAPETPESLSGTSGSSGTGSSTPSGGSGGNGGGGNGGGSNGGGPFGGGRGPCF